MTDEAEDPRLGIGGNNPPFSEILAEEQKDYVARIDKMDAELAAIDKIENDEQLEAAIAGVKRAHGAAGLIEDDRKKRNREFDDKISAVNEFFRKLGSKALGHKTRLTGLIDAYNDEKDRIQRELDAQRAEQAAEAARIRKEAGEEAGGVRGEVLKQDAERREQEADMAARSALSKSGPIRTSAGTASSREEWDLTIKDGTKIPLAKLKGHFNIKELEKAVRSWLKAHVKQKSDDPEMPGVEFFKKKKTVIR